MDRGKAISLNSLTLSHSDDIEQMLSAIRGNSESILWTAEMRAAVRGWKVMGTSLIDAATFEESAD
jgi:hypothetical protein